MKAANRPAIKYSSHKRELRFFFLFIIFFVSGQLLYYAARPALDPYLVGLLTVKASSNIINIVTPDEKTAVSEKMIHSGEFKLYLNDGCEGVDGIVLIVAALCAFPVGMKYKLSGIVAGSVIIYLANLSRIIMLYYALKYKNGFFEILHIYVGQVYIIFIGLIFFILWINMVTHAHEKTG